MFKSVLLLLPALIPSWRFFGTVEPSPRIEYALGPLGAPTPVIWTELRPRPQSLRYRDYLKRLFWNPQWNETLYLITCAERLMDSPTPHSARELRRRIIRHLRHSPPRHWQRKALTFRLVFVAREGRTITKRVLYTSAPCLIEGQRDGF